MKRYHFILMLLGMGLVMSSCVHEQNRTHNAAGGSITACGDLPGLLGDDC